MLRASARARQTGRCGRAWPERGMNDEYDHDSIHYRGSSAMSTHRLFATCILLVLASTASATDQAAEPASATLIDRQGQSVGTATFIEGPPGVLIHVSAKGLQPGP